jgi:aspartyl-tRNA(Asn)/glutamyl-tRNA(Gln) amidotransferase subunit A
MDKEYNVKELSEDIRKIWRNGAEKLESMGAIIKEISLPHTEHALPAYCIQCRD